MPGSKCTLPAIWQPYCRSRMMISVSGDRIILSSVASSSDTWKQLENYPCILFFLGWAQFMDIWCVDSTAIRTNIHIDLWKQTKFHNVVISLHSCGYSIRRGEADFKAFFVDIILPESFPVLWQSCWWSFHQESFWFPTFLCSIDLIESSLYYQSQSVLSLPLAGNRMLFLQAQQRFEAIQ